MHASGMQDSLSNKLSVEELKQISGLLSELEWRRELDGLMNNEIDNYKAMMTDYEKAIINLIRMNENNELQLAENEKRWRRRYYIEGATLLTITILILLK